MNDRTSRRQRRAAFDRAARPGRPDEPPANVYRITVKGTLDDAWSAWFDGLRITHEDDGHTALVGAVPDQTALHGILAKIRDLGLTLIAVEPRPGRPVR